MKMTNTISKFTLSLLMAVSAVFACYGQQDPMYSQYMFNIQAYNPAYAGTWKSIGMMALGRYQWIGFEGGPETQTFTIQSPMRNEKIGLGLSVINDRVGEENRFAVFSDYSFRLKLNDGVFLRLGLKAGFTNYQNDLTRYETYSSEGQDPAFGGVIEKKLMPNFGIGAFLYSQDYYIGFSIPKILQNDFEQGVENYSTGFEMRHITLIGGYVFELSETLKFKPSFITRYVDSLPIVGDLNASFLLKDKFWIGAMVRTVGQFGFNTQFNINQKLKVGYAVDFDTAKIRSFSNGTHEVMVSYELSSLKTSYTSPRYF